MKHFDTPNDYRNWVNKLARAHSEKIRNGRARTVAGNHIAAANPKNGTYMDHAEDESKLACPVTVIEHSIADHAPKPRIDTLALANLATDLENAPLN